MAGFKKALAKLQSKLGGSSIVSVSGSDNFYFSTPGVTQDSQFYIGSVSKHMTAYMLLLSLHEIYPRTNIEALLHMKLTKLFPNSQVLKKIQREWGHQISLLDLLTHRSGLSDYFDAYGDGFTVPEALNKPINAVTLLQAVSFDPEKKELYSNSNYLLIAKLIEEMNNNKLDAVFERLIKTPSNMQLSFAPTSGNYFDLKKQKSFSRLVPNLSDKVFTDMSNAIGAGNVISTISDLKKWANYLFNKAPKLIVDLMLKNYGLDSDGDVINLGFGTTDTCLGSFVGHQGSLDSYSSFFGFLGINRSLVIILSNNNADSNKLMEDMRNWISQPKTIKERKTQK
jgi:CubicO group peptidase (beta-lactamase class C family)